MDLRHSRPFRLTLLLFVALLALAGVVPYFVQADFAQSALVAQLQRDSHRTLTASRTRVVLLPRPALLLQDVSLSDPDKPAIFAQAQQMRIQLSIWPLLSHGRFEVHRVEFKKKPVVNIEHRPDGSYNFDDLLAQPDQVGNGLRFNLDRVIFKGADLRYRDNGLNESFRVAGLDLYMDNLGDPKTGSCIYKANCRSARNKRRNGAARSPPMPPCATTRKNAGCWSPISRPPLHNVETAPRRSNWPMSASPA